MTGSETVLLALGPAAITGLLGAFVARLQTRTNIRQAELVTERLRLQQAESRRQRREKAYNDFPGLMYRLDAMVGGVGTLSKDSLDRWLLDFQILYGGIELFGEAHARDRLPAVLDAMNAIGSQARRARSQPFEQSFAGLPASMWTR